MSYFIMIFFANSLLDSTCAAAWLGPKMRSPSFANASATPSASVCSGPTIVRSICCSFAKRTSPSTSLSLMFTFSAICAMPGLPGAAYSLSTSGLLETACASACSRPPFPITNTFILSPLTLFLFLILLYFPPLYNLPKTGIRKSSLHAHPCQTNAPPVTGSAHAFLS